jgi:dienelactone hydrolase
MGDMGIRRWFSPLLPGGFLPLMFAVACSESTAPQDFTFSQVQFQTVVVPGTSASTPVLLTGTLYLPAETGAPLPAVVILPSSSGIQQFREPYYAREFARANIATLIVDSFGPRGITSAVDDQSALTSYQMEADAFGALHFLRADSRFDPANIAVMGVSKGGTAALNSAFLIREQWRGTSARFAAHVSISPDCSTPHRSLATTNAPILMLLAELDDYAPALPCQSLALAIGATAGVNIETHVIPGAHHGWERIGPLNALPTAEVFGACSGIMEDTGRITVPGVPAPMTTAEYLAWARANCVTLGAHSGGGTETIRNAATSSILQFLREVW